MVCDIFLLPSSEIDYFDNQYDTNQSKLQLKNVISNSDYFIGPFFYQSRKIKQMSQRHQPGYLPWDRSGNRLLMQSSLGKSKPTNYNIPTDNFVYGAVTVQDPEHANDLIYNWKYHEKSKNPNIGKQKDLIKTNKQCVKNLLHTAKDFYGFRKTATSFKQPKEGSATIKLKLPVPEFTYGKPLQLEDPVKLVIANVYGDQDEIQRKTFYYNQSERSSTQKPKRLSFYKTNTHNKVKEANKKKMLEMEMAKRGNNQFWKLNQFSNVATKLDTRRQKHFDQGNQKESDNKSRAQSSVAA